MILKKCIEIYENEIFNMPYSYWKHSIVPIMTKAFKQLGIYHKPWTNNIIVNNTANKHIANKHNYTIQILNEIYPDDNNNSSHYCTYKGKKVLNNRFFTYDYENHTF